MSVLNDCLFSTILIYLIYNNTIKPVVDRLIMMLSKHLKQSWQNMESHLKKWVYHIIFPILGTN